MVAFHIVKLHKKPYTGVARDIIKNQVRTNGDAVME